jgi:hypothetical protein
VSAFDIHNRKPGVPQHIVAVHVKAAVIRPAVGKGIQHLGNGFLISASNTSGNSTQNRLSFVEVKKNQ